MLIIEYRIPLPLTVEEYQVAQLWSVAEVSKNETGGGEGIEVLINEPFKGVTLLPDTDYCHGQYTHKIYHLASKMPWWVRRLAPAGSMELHEKAWNAYPYCRTVLSNPDFMKENFELKTETIHLPDRGNTENAHRLPADKLSAREVVFLNIADDLPSCDDAKHLDPKKFRCEKNQRGPLSGNWWESCEPVMCCYKLVTIEFKWWGLQNRVEAFIAKQMKRLFHVFHRQVFCWMDSWYGLTMNDIRRIEAVTKSELDRQRKEGNVRGMTAAGD